MAPRSSADQNRRSAGNNSLAGLAGSVLNEIATLVRTEFKLLRTELAEKLTATGISAGLIAAGALLLLATLLLLLHAGVAALVAYGFSWTAALLMAAAATLLAGCGLLWAGLNGFRAEHLAPSKTLQQLQKDASVAQGDEP